MRWTSGAFSCRNVQFLARPLRGPDRLHPDGRPAARLRPLPRELLAQALRRPARRWRNSSSRTASSRSLAGIALLLLIGLVTGTVRTLLRDFGFRLDRTGAGLAASPGLLTKTDVTLPVKRAQAAIVASGPVREVFGWSELSSRASRRRRKSRGNHELAPLAHARRGRTRSLGEIGWRPVPRPFGLDARVASLCLVVRARAFATAACRRRCSRRLSVAASPSPSPPDCAVLVGVRALAWRRIAYALDGDRLADALGLVAATARAACPRARIQSIDYHENFVSRAGSGRRTLQFGVAGGARRRIIIPAIPTGAGALLRDELLGSLRERSFQVERSVTGQPWRWRRPPDDGARHGRAGR